MRRLGWKRLRTWLIPKSLRVQLLTRSLFILAVLLLLIGGVQYFMMKNFLYSSKAEAMENQLRSMPVDLLIRREENSSTQSGDLLPNLNKTPQGRFERPIIFTPPDTSLGYIREDGTYITLTQSTDMGYPILSAEEYAIIQERWQHHSKIKYRIVKDTNGQDQLVVFRPADSPPVPERPGFENGQEIRRTALLTDWCKWGSAPVRCSRWRSASSSSLSFYQQQRWLRVWLYICPLSGGH
ncbi:hypothetical protein [Paenibacillus caui]|uniref:hypothetical protein n=1 Tax=Paenibacillus caui TaxID=2873927 RepID=UPI003B58603D